MIPSKPDKTRAIGWRMDEDLHQKVLRAANMDNRSFSNMLDVLVREGIKYYNTQKGAKNDVGSC